MINLRDARSEITQPFLSRMVISATFYKRSFESESAKLFRGRVLKNAELRCIFENMLNICNHSIESFETLPDVSQRPRSLSAGIKRPGEMSGDKRPRYSSTRSGVRLLWDCNMKLN